MDHALRFLTDAALGCMRNRFFVWGATTRRAKPRRAPHREAPRPLPRHSEAVRPKNPYSRPFSFLLRTKTGVTDSSPSAQNDKRGAHRMTKGEAVLPSVHPLSPAAPDSSPVQGEL